MFVNDYATLYCDMGQYCKSDFGGEGVKIGQKIDYVICE